MDFGSIFLVLALALLVGVFISRPFSNRHMEQQPLIARRKEISAREQEHNALLAERDRLLTSLKELEFDQQLGKIPTDEFDTRRKELLTSGADVLRKLDELEADTPGKAPTTPSEEAYAPAPVDAELEARIAARRRQRAEKSSGFCPNCGRPVQKSDRFCASCGTTL